uniref:ROK family protein n=1 Tax=Arthrobacter sp. TaxID=1667 RepID=UPI0028996888
MTSAVLALDVGGTKTAAALVAENGRCGPVFSVPTPGADGPEAILAGMASAARQALAASDTRVTGVGVGTAGLVDPATGVIRYATDTLRGWAGTDIPARLRALLPELSPELPLAVLNDVEAHALGEAWLGAAAGCTSVLVAAVGTGIGAGVVLEGRIFRGARGMAGELAHIPVAAAAHLRCPCGKLGHLEALGSGAGLARQYLHLGGVLPPGAGGAAVVAA